VRRLLHISAAAGAAAAALAAIFLAPVKGARRRAVASAAVRRSSANVAALVGDVVDRRPRGLRRSRPGSSLADRARLALETAFGDASAALLVRADDGVVTLRGEVDEMGDIARYEAAVLSVPGVTDVHNLLRLRVYGVAARDTIATQR